MFSKLLSKVISKIKKEDYKVDKSITFSIAFSQVNKRIAMLFRGLIRKPFFGMSKGTLFIGKRTDLKCKGKIRFHGSAIIEDNVKIDALSKGGIDIGANFSIGRNSIIECTGVLRELGEKLIIGKNVGIAANAFISMRGKIEIGDDTIFGPNVALHAENHNFSNLNIPVRLQGSTRKGIKIGKNCWIGSGVIVLDGVNIGDNCIIAAGAVVNKDIPSNTIAGGIPIKIIKNRKGDK